MPHLLYNNSKEKNQDAAAAAESEETMNTREELEKIITYIENVLERYENADFCYQAGAYDAALNGVKRDLELINEILELRKDRIYP